MAVILSGISILISLLSFWIARNKASKRVLKEVRCSNLELQKQLDDIHKELDSVKERSASEISPMLSLAQAGSVSSEISMLKTELGCIRRDLEANSQTLSIHSRAIEVIQQKKPESQESATAISDTMYAQPNPFTEINSLAQASRPFQSLDTFTGLGFEQPIRTAEADFSSESVPTHPLEPLEPFEQVARQYQDAIDQGDRQALRQMQFKGLNITNESEDSLLRGNAGQATKLEAVSGGGSYMVVSNEGRYWLFPTAQTLDSFSMNQPQKGIFGYEREELLKPVVKRPAEVTEEGEYWVIVMQGVIYVPR
jgi:hypothetical protein